VHIKGARIRVLNGKFNKYFVRNPFYLQYKERFSTYLNLGPREIKIGPTDYGTK